MSNFTSVVQHVSRASPGDRLTNIVYFTAAIEFGVTPIVQLRDVATGKIVCGITYGFTIGEDLSGAMPSETYGSNPISLTMGTDPMYLQLELVLVGLAGGVRVADTKSLEPIGVIGGPSGNGGKPPVSSTSIALASIAVISLLGGAYLLLRRKR